MTPAQLRRAREALDSFTIETPSWGFADTGTRFGKFFQDAAAIDLGHARNREQALGNGIVDKPRQLFERHVVRRD